MNAIEIKKQMDALAKQYAEALEQEKLGAEEHFMEQVGIDEIEDNIKKVKEEHIRQKGFAEKRLERIAEQMAQLEKEQEEAEEEVSKLNELIEECDGFEPTEVETEENGVKVMEEDWSDVLEKLETDHKFAFEEVKKEKLRLWKLAELEKKNANKSVKKSNKKSLPIADEVVAQIVGEVKEKKEKVVKKTMKPADRWAIIPVGSQFRAKSKETIRYYKKTAEGVVECNQDGVVIGNVVFKGNQEAANDFRIVANIDYAISGWEFLQLYNKQTDKAKSLKKWNGEPEYLVW